MGGDNIGVDSKFLHELVDTFTEKLSIGAVESDELQSTHCLWSLTPAVQDIFQGECRTSTFDGMPQIVTGKVSAEDAVKEGLEIYHAN